MFKEINCFKGSIDFELFKMVRVMCTYLSEFTANKFAGHDFRLLIAFFFFIIASLQSNENERKERKKEKEKGKE